MARRPRIEYAGAVYHVLSRGDRKEDIFLDDRDRFRFLDCLGEACEKTGWRIHAYVLMPNHYHLLLETPEANLVAGMRWLQGTYTQRFNLRHKLVGHLFQGRYKALPVDLKDPMYFTVLSNYIHLNPARAHLITPGKDRLSQYRWSSYPLHISSPRGRPAWLETRRVLSAFGFVDDPRGRRRYRRHLERCAEELSEPGHRKALEAEWQAVREAWYVGDDGFKARLLDRLTEVIEGKQADSYGGQPGRAHGEHAAERIVQKSLTLLKVQEEDLSGLPKAASEKKLIAWLVRKRTTASLPWIAARLHMGHVSAVSNALRAVEKDATAGMGKAKRRLLGIL